MCKRLRYGLISADLVGPRFFPESRRILDAFTPLHSLGALYPSQHTGHQNSPLSLTACGKPSPFAPAFYRNSPTPIQIRPEALSWLSCNIL